MWHWSCFSSTRVVFPQVFFAFAVLTFIIICFCLRFISTPEPSLLHVAVLDRHLPFMEPRELPRSSEPALPFQSGMGARYPPLQQVVYTFCSAQWPRLVSFYILSSFLPLFQQWVDFKILMITFALVHLKLYHMSLNTTGGITHPGTLCWTPDGFFHYSPQTNNLSKSRSNKNTLSQGINHL